MFAEVDKQELKLNLHVPVSKTKPPLVVWIHGGGWRGGSHRNARLKSLSDHGFALASITYRFSDKAIFPAQIHDCKAAIRWLRAHAGEYGYSADWIGVAGSSAGGHLALLVGVSGKVEKLEGTVGGNLDQSSTVQAVIDYFGPSDFVLRGKTQPERAYTTKSGSLALLGGLPTGKIAPGMEAFASPSEYVSGDAPPLLVFHGIKDTVVLLDQSERILELYKKAGRPARMVTLKDAGHGAAAFFEGEHLETAIRFFGDGHAQWLDSAAE